MSGKYEKIIKRTPKIEIITSQDRSYSTFASMVNSFLERTSEITKVEYFVIPPTKSFKYFYSEYITAIISYVETYEETVWCEDSSN